MTGLAIEATGKGPWNEGPWTPAQDRTHLLLEAEQWLWRAAPVPTLAEFLDRHGHHFRNYRACWRLNLPEKRSNGWIDSFKLRDQWIERFGFAIPIDEALEKLAKTPLVEIGAGTGYWSRLIFNAGGDVIATDPDSEHFPFAVGRWFGVCPIGGKTAVRRWPERDVFCSWPSLNKTWFRQAMKALRPGRRVFVVREDACAEESTWAYLDEYFTQEDAIELPCWTGMHDELQVWRKRRNGPFAEEQEAYGRERLAMVARLARWRREPVIGAAP